jgi:hypothetical protein
MKQRTLMRKEGGMKIDATQLVDDLKRLQGGLRQKPETKEHARAMYEAVRCIEALTRPLTLDECCEALNANKYLFEEASSDLYDSWVVGLEGLWVWNGSAVLKPFEATALARAFLMQGGAA